MAGPPGPGRSCVVSVPIRARSCACGATTGCVIKSCSPTRQATQSRSSCVTVRHGQVENRIKNLKDCGLERMPFTSLTANAAWLEMVLAAADLLV